MIHQVFAVGDTHCGSRFGLCPPRVKLDGGGVYIASALQRKVWAYWLSFWREWVQSVAHGEDYAVILGGDLQDGCHPKGTAATISPNIADQHRVALACFEPVLEGAAKVYVLRGTEAHTGEAGQYEEMLARQLGAEVDDTGCYTRYHLRLRIGERTLIDAMHHIATAGVAAYSSTAPCRELSNILEESATWGYQAPDVVLRFHRHRYDEVRKASKRGMRISVTAPCWQLKPPYLWRGIARNTTPQFGGLLIREGDEEAYVRSRLWSIEPAAVEVA